MMRAGPRQVSAVYVRAWERAFNPGASARGALRTASNVHRAVAAFGAAGTSSPRDT